MRFLVGMWWVFFLGGIVGLGVSAYSHREISTREPRHGPPLYHANAIVFNGEIFVYDSWRQIRVFDTAGNSLRSWRVHSLQGGATLEFNRDGNLEVYAFRPDTLFVFSPQGELVRQFESHDGRGIRASSQRETQPDSSGTSYALEESTIFAVRDGERTVLVPPGPPIPNPAIGVAGSMYALLLGAGLGAAWWRGTAA